MNINERLKEAYWNVSYHADNTWASEICTFRRANMSLHQRETILRAHISKWTKLTPRTVRDSIPTSKLAQYANYEYDEARELSYSPMVICCEKINEQFANEVEKEPWMLNEIDDLYVGFMIYHKDTTWEPPYCHENHENLPYNMDNCQCTYQPPFLQVQGFDEMALKLKTVSYNLRKIWDIHYFPFYGWHPVSKEDSLALYRSPISQLFATITGDSQLYQHKSEEEQNVDDILALSRSLKEQNSWLYTKNYSSTTWTTDSTQDPVETSNKRLYSAVLQGSNEDKLMLTQAPSFQFTTRPVLRENSTETTEETSFQAFLNSMMQYPTTTAASTSTSNLNEIQLNRRMIEASSLSPPMYHQNYVQMSNVQTTPSSSTPITSVFATPPAYNASPSTYNNYQYFPQTNQYVRPTMYSQNYLQNTTMYNFRHTSYYPLVLPSPQPYPQNPLINYQRATYASYARTIAYSPRPIPQVVLPTTGWILPQTKIAQPNYGIYQNRPHTQQQHTTYGRSTKSVKTKFNKTPTPSKVVSPKEEQAVNAELETLATQTVKKILEEADPFVPVTETPSDILEKQALEQYNTASSGDILQELERQAAEQYENSSENWKNPPKNGNKIPFGGFRVRVYRHEG